MIVVTVVAAGTCSLVTMAIFSMLFLTRQAQVKSRVVTVQVKPPNRVETQVAVPGIVPESVVGKPVVTGIVTENVTPVVPFVSIS